MALAANRWLLRHNSDARSALIKEKQHCGECLNTDRSVRNKVHVASFHKWKALEHEEFCRSPTSGKEVFKETENCCF